jgi:hypothetical protein
MYKEEFSNNSKITHNVNEFKKNLFLNKNNMFKKKFNSNILLNDGANITNLYLKKKKKNFITESFVNPEYKYLFISNQYDNFYKNSFFKKTQKFINNKNTTEIDNLILKTTKT